MISKLRGCGASKAVLFHPEVSFLTRYLPKRSIMSNHHYKTGETFPPLSPGVLRLYSMAFCPFAERTRLVLAAKGIKYELVNINTAQKPEWYFEKNPAGSVPTLEQDGKLLQESLVICEYLDELFPDRAPMFPRDPYLKARDKIFIQQFSSYQSAARKWRNEKGENEEVRSAILKQVQVLEDELVQRGTDYFSGSSPGMVDYAVWPAVYRTTTARSLGDGSCGFPQSFTAFNRWVGRMCNHEIIRPRMLEGSAIAEFQAHHRTPNSKYDEIETKAIP